MKNILIILLLLIISFESNAQKSLTSKDSITIFYDALFTTLKSGYLHRDKIDWKNIETETYHHLSQYDNFDNSLVEIERLFGKIEATHSKVFYKEKEFSVNTKISSDALNDSWRKKYASEPKFEAKVINNNIGYILIPALKYNDLSSKNIHNIAQELYNQIANIKIKNKIDGWIIDLRFNTGGNAWHMLLALYDFLGDNKIWGTIDANQESISKIELKKGKYLDNSKKISYINPKGILLDTVKVALITSIATASSGEIIAIAFKGRPNTRFIGSPTFGATTGNIKSGLPFGSFMALTTSYDCDRNNIFYENIIPDVVISKGDNFNDLLLDKNIIEAMNFFQIADK